MLRKSIVGFSLGLCLLLGGVTAAGATNPHSGGSTGQPSQTCLSSTAPNEPGNAASSPGSPFNEPGSGGNPNNPGGTGGQHYAATSQYDVACFQVSNNH